MSQIVALAYPVMAGSEGKARDLVSEIKGRYKEFEKASKNRKVKKEAWFLQQLPGSSSLIVFFESDDVGKSISDFAQSQDSFDVWLRQSAKSITGMDFSLPREDPYPELLLSHGF